MAGKDYEEKGEWKDHKMGHPGRDASFACNRMCFHYKRNIEPME